ncbi:hypothetical protein ACMFMF_003199 [Clarireedia jacksonii]
MPLGYLYITLIEGSASNTRKSHLNYYEKNLIKTRDYLAQVYVDWLPSNNGFNNYKYRYGNSVNISFYQNNKTVSVNYTRRVIALELTF